MRLLTDQDGYAVTVQRLRDWGHDVATAAEMGLFRATDAALLRAAETEDRILVTRDRDFGNLVFVDQLAAGVVYLRMLPATMDAVHVELERVLKRYGHADLRRSFVAIQPGRHRLRRLPAADLGDADG